MSVYKQLWLALFLLMTLVLCGTLGVSSLSAKTYLEQQLYLKNSDNAVALALSMSQQDADPVLLELTLSAQFDTGHYELIQFTDPAGKVIISRQDTQVIADAPRWFINLFPIEVQAGVAQVQSGWQQLGTLTLRSHSRFVYRELWQNTQQLAGYFLLAMVLAGLVGSYLMTLILRPLQDVVAQAEAIGERRFITTSEPRTLEFKAVIRAMNKLSTRIKSMLHQEASRLEKWRKESQVDKVTGLLIREPFLKLLAAALERDDASASGAIIMIHISDLTDLNHLHGRSTMDVILAKFGSTLNKLDIQNSGWAAGRLNGSDFAVLAPHAADPAAVGRVVQQAMFEVLRYQGLENEVKLPGVSAAYNAGDQMSELLRNLDANLSANRQEGESSMSLVQWGDIELAPERQDLDTWHKVFRTSFLDDKFSLAEFPVTDLAGKLIHMEAPVRLQWHNDNLTAGQLLPWINRLNLAGDLDKQVINLALQNIARDGVPTCVNLSVTSVSDPGFLLWLSDTLAAHVGYADKLWMEVQEPMAYRYLDAFRKLCIRAKHYGCKMGIEHLGHQLSDIGRLHDVGLDYVKIDSAFIRDIDTNPANQTLLRTLCTLVHSVGLTVIAEGVQNEREWSMLDGLGLDGATGPEVTNRHQ